MRFILEASSYEFSTARRTKNNEAKARPLTAILLAAGKGTRMVSPLPKVLHPVAGKAMIENVINACRAAGVEDVRVVAGHGLNLVKTVLESFGVHIYVQAQQLGTADAVHSAQPDTIEGDVVILNGDHPLMKTEDIKQFITEFQTRKLDLAVVTAELKNPREFGRIVRHKGSLAAIVEAKRCFCRDSENSRGQYGYLYCESRCAF